MYTVIPDTPRASTSYRDAPGASHATDGIIGSVSQQPQPQPTPPTITPQPSNTANVAYQNQALDYARMMSQSGSTTSYAQPVPPRQAQDMAWPTQEYVEKILTFVAPPPPQIYYAPPVEPVQSPNIRSTRSVGTSVRTTKPFQPACPQQSTRAS